MLHIHKIIIINTFTKLSVVFIIRFKIIQEKKWLVQLVPKSWNIAINKEVWLCLTKDEGKTKDYF